jgi:hypothetical protein
MRGGQGIDAYVWTNEFLVWSWNDVNGVLMAKLGYEAITT